VIVAAPESNPTPEELARRGAWFNDYVGRVAATPAALPLRCPCCGCKTLAERAGYEICDVCFWEDDGQDDHDADVIRGGPNGRLSLSEARQNYQQFGACERRHVANVRPPLPNEMPD
jgi:hypothetical protein